MKNNYEQDLIEDLKRLLELHKELVSKKSIGEAINVMKDVDILLNQLKKIEFKQKVLKTYFYENGEEKNLVANWRQDLFENIKDVEVQIVKPGSGVQTTEVLEVISKNWGSTAPELKRVILELIASKLSSVEEQADVYPLRISDEGVTVPLHRPNRWYDMLETFVKEKKTCILNVCSGCMENNHRASGKTTALIRLSSDYGIPIISNGLQSTKRELDEKSWNSHLHSLIVKDANALRGSEYSDCEIVLVDEGTDIDAIDKNKYIVIGFTLK